MYNLDETVKMYFDCISAKRLLKEKSFFEEKWFYEKVPQDEFALLAKAYITYYSETEHEQLYEYIKSSEHEDGHPFAGMHHRSGLNVFTALEELAEELLAMENNQVVCVYGKLLRLRNVTEAVEEDLLVCAYVAGRFRRTGRRHGDFTWNTVIGHNNVQLRRIMERGISENHFHLFGSAPSFHLIWIYFMNHVGDNLLYQFAEEAERKQRVTRQQYSVQYSEDSILIRILKAALIRVHLILCLQEEKNEHFCYDAERLLSGRDDIREYCLDIRDTIDQFRNSMITADGEEITDYALQVADNTGNGVHGWTAGERWFMYSVLCDELSNGSKRRLSGKYYQWFYAYLVIKQSIRREIVQLNGTVGFENFSRYDKRKRIYPDHDKMIEAAVYGSVESGNLRSLEMRISPGDNVHDSALWLKRTDNVIQRKKALFPDVDYYYVIHFSKSREVLEEERDFDGRHCRHHKKRRELELQANTLFLLRENYRGIASKILGIDACAQEIGCRPEVFAPIFRFLSGHIVEDVPGMPRVGQLKMTYHVGEDFLDIVDGLRAVDEAVCFLNLKCGDRIGHGTVLGIDVLNWYKRKQYTIVLSKQDYLDNVAWLYHKITEYKIDGLDNLREKLLQEFDFYFAEIYGSIEQENGRLSNRTDCSGLYRNTYGDGSRNANIHSYFEAWKLRGDEPSLYREGHFDGDEIFFEREWLVNRKFPENHRSRRHDEIGYLYYLYHYDWNVRNNGQKSIQKFIPLMYVEGVAAVQKAMQKDFATKGIGIEANPSSNRAISMIEDYTEHPIVKLYNKDLIWDMDQMRDCPQIYISINTDDKGVFHTTLENEYALMACAMEKVRDEKGMPVFERQRIYQWIDNIRVMGNMQSFRERSLRTDTEEEDG
ncbi:MAG: hypothetical protein HFH83_10290 [Lachnospiraceae bacterium]|nr:hypothetical protein [Lachnospiraceae bacterium]